jgi:hypothetical protein
MFLDILITAFNFAAAYSYWFIGMLAIAFAGDIKRAIERLI